MSEVKHTSGPWFVDKTKALGPMGVYSETAPQEVSGVCWFDHARDAVRGRRMSREEIEANAQLIAASPDLLAACDDGLAFVRHALEFFDWSRFPHLYESVEQLRDKMAAAVAKAKGA